MSEIINPILQHRQEVRDKIFKGFESDEIEKAQYVHKYINKVFTNKGKTRYIYETAKNIIRVKGKKETKMKNDKAVAENTTLNKKFFMIYSDEMRAELQNEVSAIDDVQDIELGKSKKENSHYIMFKKDGHDFNIRTSNHTKITYYDEDENGKKLRNGVHFPLFYDAGNEWWCIDASLGNYKPKDVKEIVENLCSKLSKYKNSKTRKKIEEFAEKKEYSPQTREDVKNKAHTLAIKYINDCGLKDDKYGTTFQVILLMSRKALYRILDRDDD